MLCTSACVLCTSACVLCTSVLCTSAFVLFAPACLKLHTDGVGCFGGRTETLIISVRPC